MTTPSERASARAFLAQLEHDPKHRREADPARADRETSEDDVSDPAHQKHVPQDARWHQDANGNWHHPDFEE